MEKLNCKSCGGTLQKTGPAEYKCVFCGTVHQLDLDDSVSVAGLIEQNNQRWLFINRSMDLFHEKVNDIISYKSALRNPRLAMLIVSGICGLVLANLGYLFFAALARESRGMVMKDLTPFLAVVGFMLVLDGYYAALLIYGLRRLRKMRAEARALVVEVLASYQQMSDKPARDLILSLHNPRKLMGQDAVKMAMDIYTQALMALPDRGGGPGTGL